MSLNLKKIRANSSECYCERDFKKTNYTKVMLITIILVSTVLVRLIYTCKQKI